MSANEITFLIIALSIVTLVIFTIKFLCRADKTLTKVDTALEEIDIKMKSVTPLFHLISNVSEGLEYRAATFKKQQLLKSLKEDLCQNEPLNEEPDHSLYLDLVDCALLSLRIWKKLKDKKAKE